MLPQALILIYGHDSQLLATRRLILERVGYRAETATDLNSIARIIACEPIGLLILCHTLSMEENGHALALVHTRWPWAQTIILAAGRGGYVVGSSSEVVDAREGPAQLLRVVKRLLRTPIPEPSFHLN